MLAGVFGRCFRVCQGGGGGDGGDCLVVGGFPVVLMGDGWRRVFGRKIGVWKLRTSTLGDRGCREWFRAVYSTGGCWRVQRREFGLLWQRREYVCCRYQPIIKRRVSERNRIWVVVGGFTAPTRWYVCTVVTPRPATGINYLSLIIL